MPQICRPWHLLFIVDNIVAIYSKEFAKGKLFLMSFSKVTVGRDMVENITRNMNISPHCGRFHKTSYIIFKKMIG